MGPLFLYPVIQIFAYLKNTEMFSSRNFILSDFTFRVSDTFITFEQCGINKGFFCFNSIWTPSCSSTMC